MVRDFTTLWFSEEYHHSKNCRKKTPRDREVERDTAVPLAAWDINHHALCIRLQTEEQRIIGGRFKEFLIVNLKTAIYLPPAGLLVLLVLSSMSLIS